MESSKEWAKPTPRSHATRASSTPIAAASATLEFTELTFVHNNWIADTSIEGVLYTRRANDLGIAAGGKFLHVPFTRYDALSQQVAGGRYSEGTVGLNVSYNFARSYEFPGVAVGATVKTAYRYVPAPDRRRPIGRGNRG